MKSDSLYPICPRLSSGDDLYVVKLGWHQVDSLHHSSPAWNTGAKLAKSWQKIADQQFSEQRKDKASWMKGP
jgi:hypothetical protein